MDRALTIGDRLFLPSQYETLMEFISEICFKCKKVRFLFLSAFDTKTGHTFKRSKNIKYASYKSTEGLKYYSVYHQGSRFKKIPSF